MRRYWHTAAGLCLASLAGLGVARGTDLKGGPAIKPGVSIVDSVKPACGKHGTTVEFLATPSEAATQAKKEGKLVFVLHVSGHFEDPRFT